MTPKSNQCIPILLSIAQPGPGGGGGGGEEGGVCCCVEELKKKNHCILIYLSLGNQYNSITILTWTDLFK